MSRSRFALVVTTALAFGLSVPLARAHSSFLVPSSTVLSKPQWVTIDGASGNDIFYFNHAPLRLDGLAITAPDGSVVAPENVVVGKLRSVFDLNLTQTGTYRVANGFSGVTARYKDAATGQNKGFRGTAENFVRDVPADAPGLTVNEGISRLETFITVGKPSAIQPVGKGLEFVPVTHPNDLFTGEAATFGFLLDGKPAVDLEVEIIFGGTRYRDKIGEIVLKTDANGQVKVNWPQPGLYRLEISTKDDKTTLKQAKERRLVYAAVLEVLPQ